MGAWVRVGSAAAVAGFLAAALACGGGGGNGTPPTPVTAALAGVPLTTASVTGGSPASGNVTLTAAAPSGGATVALTSSNTAVATVPPNVTIPAGSASAGYTVATSAVPNTTSVTITGSYLGATQTAVLSVTAAAVTVRADFNVIPNGDTTAPAGQCSVSRTSSGNLMNTLRCKFDASISTPASGITRYDWVFPGNTAVSTANNFVQDPLVPCGTFPGAAGLDVRLTITTAQGTSSATKTITFIKANEC